MNFITLTCPTEYNEDLFKIFASVPAIAMSFVVEKNQSHIHVITDKSWTFFRAKFDYYIHCEPVRSVDKARTYILHTQFQKHSGTVRIKEKIIHAVPREVKPMKVEIVDGMNYTARQQYANEKKAALFIAIHNNGASDTRAKGCMTIVANNASKKSYDLAKQFVVHMEALGISRRSSPRGDGVFYGSENGNRGNSQIVKTSMPAFLTECLFLTNPDESRFMLFQEGITKIACALVQLIKDNCKPNDLVILSPGHNAGISSNKYGTYIYGHPDHAVINQVPVLTPPAPRKELYEYDINLMIARRVIELMRDAK